MDRRTFVKSAGMLGLSLASRRTLLASSRSLCTPENAQAQLNTNWIDRKLHASVKVSSFVADPPWGYGPSNIFGDDLHAGWEAKSQTNGAWLEIDFDEERTVAEIWILASPLPRDILGEDAYLLAYSQPELFAAPRRIRCSFSSGKDLIADLRQTKYFEILTLPEPQKTASIRFNIEEVWSTPKTKETGIAKLQAYPYRHDRSFEIDIYSMYDVHDEKPVQSATLSIINPTEAVKNSSLVVSRNGKILMQVPLTEIPAQSVTQQEIWIPATSVEGVIDFEIVPSFGCSRSLHVTPYHSYFDNGSFGLNCTCHNDLGWLNTQKKTADYRSAEIILPAMKLLRENPDFCYSMECTAYLMEFLERHPEHKEEMTGYIRDKRFIWGASYVDNQEVHVGPEKLVRQFYYGKRWLEQTFPGADTSFYVKADPPSMTLQMPQILVRAGVKHNLQGRMPFGFYHWEAPDGSFVLTYALRYPMQLINPKGNQGWLSHAERREDYYKEHHLPSMFIYDYTADYLPPQPTLPAYVREQNSAMKHFAEIWNRQNPSSPIHPPEMVFVTPDSFLDQFSKDPLDITTLKGDWPFNWAYYDEPSNREGLLAGREAHNRLLTAERIFAALGVERGFQEYPQEIFTDAWKANCWPDHGWGGNVGQITDSVYIDSYEKSKKLADELLHTAGSRLIRKVSGNSETKISLVVFNPLNWDRTDIVEYQFVKPSGWDHIAVRDESGKAVPYEITEENDSKVTIVFVAKDVPSIGYRSYYIEPTSSLPEVNPIEGWVAENEFFKVVFGSGGIQSLYDKRLQWEAFRTGKFEGGEVIQFTAPGDAWEDPEIVTMQNFDQTSRHPFPFKLFTRSEVRTTAVREASFPNFTLREHFHLYHELDRVDIDLEILNWDGQKERELRVAFPINLDDAQITYEVPFGKVELGKDELDFALLPSDSHSVFRPNLYGGDHPLAFREAINWIDASDSDYQGHGFLCASDSTVHLFRDESTNPVSGPLLQHVLLSTRKSLAWNPDYWFTQPGNHRYRMSLLPHKRDWRLRYREALGFNYPLTCFIGSSGQASSEGSTSESKGFLRLNPENLILTALKKSEDDDRVIIRFYEAEGFETTAQIKFSKPVIKAWRASLIEYDETPIQVTADGNLVLSIQPWEIITIKVAIQAGEIY